MPRESKTIDPPISTSTKEDQDSSATEILSRLDQAVSVWIERGSSRPLHGWLARARSMGRDCLGDCRLRGVGVLGLEWRKRARLVRKVGPNLGTIDSRRGWPARSAFPGPDASLVFGPHDSPDVNAITPRGAASPRGGGEDGPRSLVRARRSAARRSRSLRCPQSRFRTGRSPCCGPIGRRTATWWRSTTEILGCPASSR